MSEDGHEFYRNSIRKWIRKHGDEPGVRDELSKYADVLLVLWYLDLEPARPTLKACYAPNPRGGDPHDPLVMLRCLLLALLVGQPSINKWVADLAGSRVLRILTGLPDDKRPGVGTLYDFMHRLHDGPIRRTCEHVERPSVVERRRALEPRPKPAKKDARKKKEAAKKRKKTWARARRKSHTVKQAPPPDEAQADLGSVTERLVQELSKSEHLPNANDLLGRLSDILIDVAVLESAKRGLLGDVEALTLGSDGSPLRTGANRFGKRACDHSPRERCDCPRIFTDPDATWGWDSHRKVWFFGHHFYETSASIAGVDLPLSIRLDPANETDMTASLRDLDHLRRALRERGSDFSIAKWVADAGHDAEAIYGYCIDRGIIPIIPLAKEAPAQHPQRGDVRLSKRGVPLCQGNSEMAYWGSGGKGTTLFICPKKANKCERCPIAPDDDPNWVCKPDLKWGPAVNVKTDQNPRLCPPIPRNSSRYEELYKLRSGTERSNSVKKEIFKLEAARHRRASFWLIRLHLIAVLQHAKAWARGLSGEELLDELFCEDYAAAA